MFTSDWEELLFISGYEAVWNRPAQRIKDNPTDFLTVVHPDDREFVEQNMEKLSRGESIDIEYRIHKGDGSLAWVWVKGEPIFENGTVARVVGFTRDITDRKQRETELQLRTQALNEAPVGVVMTDPAQDDNPITYVNDAFLALTGYERDDVIGENCRLLQGPDTAAEPVAAMRQAIDADEPVTVELRNYRKDGTMFWNRVSIAPIYHEDGTVQNYIGFQVDVTERKRREHQLVVLGRVLRHNLRNAMNVIQSRAELIQASGDETVTENAINILSETDKLMALTEKEQRITEVVTEKPTTREIDLQSLLQRQIERVSTEFSNATVSLECPEPVHISVSTRFEQAIEELLWNAVTHTDGGSPTVSVTVSVEADTIRVTVADDCPRIPEMELNALLDREKKDPLYHGSGLGLWLVNLIVTQSGGSISYEPNDPRGNRIQIELSR